MATLAVPPPFKQTSFHQNRRPQDLSWLLFLSPGLRKCQPGWDAFEGFCYKHFSARRSWEDAETRCREHGGHLANIMSPEEQSFINSRGLGLGSIWSFRAGGNVQLFWLPEQTCAISPCRHWACPLHWGFQGSILLPHLPGLLVSPPVQWERVGDPGVPRREVSFHCFGCSYCAFPLSGPEQGG